VFLGDIIKSGKVYVHRIFVNFVEPIRDRMKIALKLSVRQQMDKIIN